MTSDHVWLLLLFGFKEVAMIGGMLNLGQLQERANDVHLEQRFIILAVFAKRLRLRQMISHGIDGCLHIFVRTNALREGGRLAPGLKTEGAPIIDRLIDCGIARFFSMRAACRKGRIKPAPRQDGDGEQSKGDGYALHRGRNLLTAARREQQYVGCARASVGMTELPKISLALPGAVLPSRAQGPLTSP